MFYIAGLNFSALLQEQSTHSSDLMTPLECELNLITEKFHCQAFCLLGDFYHLIDGNALPQNEVLAFFGAVIIETT